MRKPRVPFCPEVADRICDALRSGQGLRRLCREPGMPTRATIMRWLKEKPRFAEDVGLSRWCSGLDGGSGMGRPSGYSREAHDALAEALVSGVPLRTVCRDPAFPSREAGGVGATISAWRASG
jgi:hypothetical protein